MNAPFLTRRMNVEEFLAWVDSRAASLPYDEPKWELFDGVPEMQEHERWNHARIKLAVTIAFRSAIERAGIAFEVAVDGLGVRIGTRESYQPEVIVFPSGRIGEHDRHAPDPIVVVEVLSPSTRAKDLTSKAKGYEQVQSIKYYLVVDPDAREVVIHRRNDESLVPDADPLGVGATVTLDPPGLTVGTAEFFA